MANQRPTTTDDTVWRFRAFGRLRVFRNDSPISLPGRRSAQLLLACLLLNAGEPLSRTLLIQRLFPESDESSARRRLSRSLWHLRNILPSDDLIEVSNRQIRLCLSPAVDIDFIRFQEAVTNAPADDEMTVDSAEHLLQAANLCTGELLEGFYEDWVESARRAGTDRFCKLLHKLSRWEKQHGRYQNALTHTERIARQEPYSESVLQEIMQLHLMLQNPHRALERYRQFQEVLTLAGIQPSGNLLTFVRSVEERSVTVAQPTTSDSFAVALFGRERERALLARCLDGICREPEQAEGGVVLIEGAAGIGKSRLISACIRDARWRGVSVMHGGHDEQSATRFLSGFFRSVNEGLTALRVQLLEMAVDEIHLRAAVAHVPKLREFMPGLDALPTLENEEEAERLIIALVRGLQQWTTVVPTLLVLEDIHRADRTTFDLLIKMADMLRGSRCLVVATYRKRPAIADGTLWERLRKLDEAPLLHRPKLEPLDDAAMIRLLHALLHPSRPSLSMQQQLLQRSGGNPLFLVETVRMYMQEGLPVRDAAGNWTLPSDLAQESRALPRVPLLQQTIQRRVNRLSAETRTLLEHAAILGSHFPLKLLRELSDLPPAVLLAEIQTLLRLDFLRENSRLLRFVHDNVHEVVVQGISAEQQIKLHSKVAAILRRDAPDNMEELVRHLQAAQLWAEAVACLEQLGRDAAKLSAWTPALGYMGRAVEILETHLPATKSNRIRLFELRAARRELLHNVGSKKQLESDVQAMKAAADRLDPPYYMVHALLAEAFFLGSVRSDYSAAIRSAARARRIAVRHDERDAVAHALELEGRFNYLADRYEEAARLLEQAVEKRLTLTPETVDTGRAWHRLLYLRYFLAVTYRRLGRHEAAGTIAAQLLVDARNARSIENEIRARQLLSLLDFDAGRAQAGLHNSEAALELARSTGSDRIINTVAISLAVAYARIPLWSKAIEQYERLLTHYRATDNVRRLCVTLTNYGYCLVLIGAFDQAELLLRQGLELTRKSRLPRWELLLLRGLVELHLLRNTAQGRVRAEKRLAQVDAIAQTIDSPSDLALLHLLRARLAIQQNAPQAALHDLAAAASIEAASPELPAEIAVYRSQALGQLANLKEALTAAELAVEKLDSRTGRMAPTALWQVAVAAENIGDRMRAQRYLEEAYAVVTVHAQTLDDPAERARFLTRIPVHRQIAEAYERGRHRLAPGQIRLKLPKTDAPRTRQLRDDELIQVTWTVEAPEDEKVAGKIALRRHRLQRLIAESAEQGARETQQALAEALGVGLRTIERDMAQLRKNGLI